MLKINSSYKNIHECIEDLELLIDKSNFTKTIVYDERKHKNLFVCMINNKKILKAFNKLSNEALKEKALFFETINEPKRAVKLYKIIEDN